MTKRKVGIIHLARGNDVAMATWIAARLADKGFEVVVSDYVPGGSIYAAFGRGMLDTEFSLVLLSEASMRDLGLGYAEIRFLGGREKLLPVKVEPCTSAALLAGIMMGEIYGQDEAADLAWLERIVRAGLGQPEPHRVSRPPFPQS
ncbi:MAG TPA: toll/interleukin-1 receptor domain-containing protein [Candidatus Saccharimonadales bacterium]|nr:toll/interleukin-1 receptor domain-containing protein [Candidatus Saccharimonadales bacterium]